jgi:hypothetical protein
MRPLFLLTLLAGCQEGAPEMTESLLIDSELAPPLTLGLDVTAVVPGQSLVLTAQGVQPGSRALFFLSTRGAGVGPCAPSGTVCLDIQGPVTQLGDAVANAQGIVTIQRTVPSPLQVDDIWFQAVTVVGPNPGVSPVVYRVVGDADLDRFAPPADCDDADPFVAPGLAESCNGVDEDCDGFVDDGMTGPLNSNQLGACASTRQMCAGAAGWVEDYSGVPGYGLPETPDGAFADENCDGIDGDVNNGVFVSTTGADVGNTQCSRATPCRSIPYAGAVAEATGRQQVYIQGGTYVGGFEVGPWSLYGGYGPDWSRLPLGTSGHDVYLAGALHPAHGQVGLVVNGQAVTLSDLAVIAGDAQGVTGSLRGRSSIGLYAAAADLTLLRCSVAAGAGAPGQAGAAGSNASNAANGGAGQAGQEVFSTCSLDRRAGGAGGVGSCGATGGAGGSGGGADTCCSSFLGIEQCSTCNCDATAGFAGASASGGGTGGGGGGACLAGANGGAGAPGGHGAGGLPATNARGRVVSGVWESVLAGGGGLGANGTAGGGGGGAGGCDTGTDDQGAGGGGGGAGGCRSGSGGAPGTGGGGSFGVFAVDSSLTVRGSTVSSGLGGAGGAGGIGGRGGLGGLGGLGGAAAPDGGSGGNGGRGGDGGSSGGGAGGDGGLSAVFFVLDSTVDETGGTYTTGFGGPAGAGGQAAASGAQAGQPGRTGASTVAFTCADASGC